MSARFHLRLADVSFRVKAENLLKYKAFNESLTKKSSKRRRSHQMSKGDDDDLSWTERVTKNESTFARRKCRRPCRNDDGELIADLSMNDSQDGEDAMIQFDSISTRRWNIQQPDVYIQEENVKMTTSFSFVK